MLHFTLESAGLIVAESAAKQDPSFWQALAGQPSMKQTKVNAFIEHVGKATKVRLNFLTVNQTSVAYGQLLRYDNPVLEEKFYQNAFEKIESAIFVRSSH